MKNVIYQFFRHPLIAIPVVGVIIFLVTWGIDVRIIKQTATLPVRHGHAGLSARHYYACRHSCSIGRDRYGFSLKAVMWQV